MKNESVGPHKNRTKRTLTPRVAIFCLVLASPAIVSANEAVNGTWSSQAHIVINDSELISVADFNNGFEWRSNYALWTYRAPFSSANFAAGTAPNPASGDAGECHNKPGTTEPATTAIWNTSLGTHNIVAPNSLTFYVQEDPTHLMPPSGYHVYTTWTDGRGNLMEAYAEFTDQSNSIKGNDYGDANNPGTWKMSNQYGEQCLLPEEIPAKTIEVRIDGPINWDGTGPSWLFGVAAGQAAIGTDAANIADVTLGQLHPPIPPNSCTVSASANSVSKSFARATDLPPYTTVWETTADNLNTVTISCLNNLASTTITASGGRQGNGSYYTALTPSVGLGVNTHLCPGTDDCEVQQYDNTSQLCTTSGTECQFSIASTFENDGAPSTTVGTYTGDVTYTFTYD